MQKIIINAQSEIRFNRKALEVNTHKVLGVLGIASSSALSITMVSSVQIRSLNKRYFRKNRITPCSALMGIKYRRKNILFL